MNRATIGAQSTIARQGYVTLESVDFSKPERHVREILDFLTSVTITNDLNT